MHKGSTRQRDVFLEGEGDASHRRRLARRYGPAEQVPEADPGDWLRGDPVGAVLLDLELQPTQTLEIGSRSGDRLAALKAHFRLARATGIEPSSAAIEAASVDHPGLEFHRGTADSLPFFEDAFNLVVASLCLSLCDPTDLFRIAAEIDRVLRPGGHLVVYDYYPDAPHRRPYRHREGVYAVKMDYAQMFRWHPGYQPVHVELFAAPPERPAEGEDRVAVQVLYRGPIRLPMVD